MPFFTHHKQHSWPPFHTSSSSPQPSTSPPPNSRSSSFTRTPPLQEKDVPLLERDPDREIDLNPFSFFISPAGSEFDDTDSSDDDDYSSAGITIEPPKRSRSLSTLPKRGHETEINFYDEQFHAASRPRSPKSVLNRFIERHVHNIETEDEDIGGPLTRSKSFSSALGSLGSGNKSEFAGSGAGRGRHGYDLGSLSAAREFPMDGMRGRVIIRSHSPKPRSWREPSVALWPVLEDPDLEETLGQSEEKGKDIEVKRGKVRKGNEYLFAKSI